MAKHAATATITPLFRVRRTPRHRAVPVARHRAPRRSWLTYVTASLPVLVAATLALLALAAPTQSATAAVRADTAEYAVALTLVQPATAPADDVIEEDDPRFDCTTMGNRACSETRTDPRFPGVSFHYVVLHDAAGQPIQTLTQRQFDASIGAPLTPSTRTDKY